MKNLVSTKSRNHSLKFVQNMMAKIIYLNTTQNNSIYNEQLENMVEFMNETIVDIDTYAINLAY
jgi:hypothetical protein